MVSIQPFKALLPPPERAHLVAAVPYDVVNREEAATLANGNPYSFLRVSRSEIELPTTVDPYSQEVYDRARANFERLQKEAPLTADSSASFYLYSQVFQGRRQTGLVAATAVDDYDADRIKKHELTRQDKEDDRTKHTLTLRAHSGPIFLTYQPHSQVNVIMDRVMQQPRLFDITAPDGVKHEVWRVPESMNNDLIEHFQNVDCLYIADGHHRAKSASRAREACRRQNPAHTGQEAYNRFLSVIFPADQLAILPYHRVIKDLHGKSVAEFITQVNTVFPCEKSDRQQPLRPGQAHLYCQDSWYCLTLDKYKTIGSVVDRLDVNILQNYLLAPLLGIADPRADKRIDFVGGIHGPGKLVKLVDSGAFVVAFCMYPVTVNELMAISDAGMIMPPKSTWFEPKLRDGLFCHCF